MRELLERPALLRNERDVLKAIVKQDDLDRTKAMAAAAADAAAAMANQLEPAVSNITAAWDEYRKASEGLKAIGASHDFVGPPEPPPVKLPNFRNAFEDMVKAARESGNRIGDALSEGWKRFKKHGEKLAKDHKDLLDRVNEVRFSIYPEEKMQAEIAAVRKMRAELVKLGQAWRFSEGDEAKVIAKMRSPTRKIQGG